jgi:hypothetical protein
MIHFHFIIPEDACDVADASKVPLMIAMKRGPSHQPACRQGSVCPVFSSFCRDKSSCTFAKCAPVTGRTLFYFA